MKKRAPRLTVLAAALALSLFWGLSAAAPARAASYETLSAAGTGPAIELPGENHRHGHGHGGRQGRRGGGGCWY